MSIADDYADIAKHLRALSPSGMLFADEPEVETCTTCEGGGWECYGIGHHDPHFRVCRACGNPEGHPSP